MTAHAGVRHPRVRARRRAATAVAALAAVAVLGGATVGCAQDFEKGSDGRVVDKVKDGKKRYLVVKTKG